MFFVDVCDLVGELILVLSGTRQHRWLICTDHLCFLQTPEEVTEMGTDYKGFATVKADC